MTTIVSVAGTRGQVSSIRPKSVCLMLDGKVMNDMAWIQFATLGRKNSKTRGS